MIQSLIRRYVDDVWIPNAVFVCCYTLQLTAGVMTGHVNPFFAALSCVAFFGILLACVINFAKRKYNKAVCHLFCLLFLSGVVLYAFTLFA